MISLETETHSELKRSRVGNRRNLSERRQRICRVYSDTEGPVQGYTVNMVESVETLHHSFQSEALLDLEGTAQTRTHVQEVEAASRVAADERAVHCGSRGGALDGSGSGRN